MMILKFDDLPQTVMCGLNHVLPSIASTRSEHRVLVMISVLCASWFAVAGDQAASENEQNASTAIHVLFKHFDWLSVATRCQLPANQKCFPPSLGCVHVPKHNKSRKSAQNTPRLILSSVCPYHTRLCPHHEQCPQNTLTATSTSSEITSASPSVMYARQLAAANSTCAEPVHFCRPQLPAKSEMKSYDKNWLASFLSQWGKRVICWHYAACQVKQVCSPSWPIPIELPHCQAPSSRLLDTIKLYAHVMDTNTVQTDINSTLMEQHSEWSPIFFFSFRYWKCWEGATDGRRREKGCKQHGIMYNIRLS